MRAVLGYIDKIPYHVAILGTIAAIVAALIVSGLAHAIIHAGSKGDAREHYRKRKMVNTFVVVAAAIAILALWFRLFEHKSTALGLIGAGLAVALREPLLSVAGRMFIFFAHIYNAGDRVEINKITGDVIDVGFFYTRIMEVGNWIHGDQATGRIVQFPNSQIFGTAVFNYTRNFAYIWDEVNLPVTYASNVKAARDILLEAGREYTKEFLQGAQQQMEEMQHYFLVPKIELEPVVYMKVTDNWVELWLRYVVEPKKRRAATNFIYERAFAQLQKHKDISIASSTMDIAVHGPNNQPLFGEGQEPKAA